MMLDVVMERPMPLANSIQRAAERADLSKSHLRNEIRAGNLKSVRVGRRVLILEEDLKSYLNGKTGDEN